jgi:hypothetical protein
MIISRGKQRTSDFKMLQDFKRPHESSKDFMRLHDTSHYVKRLLKTYKDFQRFLDFKPEVSVVSP